MITLKGSPGSPYTRKMLAVLRYRRVPYRLVQSGSAAVAQYPKPRVDLLPVFYFKTANGEIEPVVDSTPIIRRLENEHNERTVIPKHPVLRFLDYLLEDYADEWLTKAMFHYRWYNPVDARRAGDVLPYWYDFSAPQAEIDARAEAFVTRQLGRLHVVGSSDQTADLIEASYGRFLHLLNKHLTQHAFVNGARPGAADFAMMGQLSCLAQFDPTPMQMCLLQTPRIYAWVSLLDDLSGHDPKDHQWLDPTAIPTTLIDLLRELGRTYVPVMLANEQAVQERKVSPDVMVETRIDGHPWVQHPNTYQAHCLAWIRQEHQQLTASDRAMVDAIITGTGCEALLTDA